MTLDRKGAVVKSKVNRAVGIGSIVVISGLFRTRPVRIPNLKGKEKQEAQVLLKSIRGSFE